MHSGFTLIELMVVLAVISTLLLLVTPRYFAQLDISKETVLRDNLQITRQIIDKFYGDYGRYPESLDELVDRKYLRSLPFDPISESTETWQPVAVPEGYKGKVYDIRSGAPGKGRDGRAYGTW